MIAPVSKNADFHNNHDRKKDEKKNRERSQCYPPRAKSGLISLLHMEYTHFREVQSHFFYQMQPCFQEDTSPLISGDGSLLREIVKQMVLQKDRWLLSKVLWLEPGDLTCNQGSPREDPSKLS